MLSSNIGVSNSSDLPCLPYEGLYIYMYVYTAYILSGQAAHQGMEHASDCFIRSLPRAGDGDGATQCIHISDQPTEIENPSDAIWTPSRKNNLYIKEMSASSSSH